MRQNSKRTPSNQSYLLHVYQIARTDLISASASAAVAVLWWWSSCEANSDQFLVHGQNQRCSWRTWSCGPRLHVATVRKHILHRRRRPLGDRAADQPVMTAAIALVSTESLPNSLMISCAFCMTLRSAISGIDFNSGRKSCSRVSKSSIASLRENTGSAYKSSNISFV